jgi:predicted DNA-binding transcriptional regulator YafY
VSFAKAQDLIRLANMAAGRRGVTLADICEAFGCVHRTAQRMTVALEAAFPATEQRIDDDRRTRWVLPTRPLAHLLTATADELAALSAASDALIRESMTTEATLLRRLDAKVRALIPPPTGIRLAVDEEALLEVLGHAVRPGPRPAANFEVDKAIFEALKGPFQLRIVYRSRGDDMPRERTVAPHGLLLGVRRYLVARDLSKPASRLRHYRVEEIDEAEVLDESFELDVGFNIREHAQRGFSSYESEEEHGEVVWRFHPHAAAHARRYQFHPTQVLEEAADGALIVRFKASGHLEMCWHLYAWGDAVDVLAPNALRDMIDGHRRTDFPALP